MLNANMAASNGLEIVESCGVKLSLCWMRPQPTVDAIPQMYTEQKTSSSDTGKGPQDRTSKNTDTGKRIFVGIEPEELMVPPPNTDWSEIVDPVFFGPDQLSYAKSVTATPGRAETSSSQRVEDRAGGNA